MYVRQRLGPRTRCARDNTRRSVAVSRLLCAEVEHRPEGLNDAHWWPLESIGEAGLPTLFAKLAARGLAWREKEKAPADVRQGVLI